jgi:transposase-like protein
MSGVMEGRMGGSGGESERSRWSARRKEEMVLRLLRGEGLDALARESGQAAGTISSWREDFLAAGHEGLKTRPAPMEDRRLADAQRKMGSTV